MYYLLALFTLILSGKLFSKAAGTISIYRLHMMSWIFYVSFFVASFIGAVLVVNQLDNGVVNDSLDLKSSRYMGFAAVLFTMIFFPVGMIFANKCFGISDPKAIFNQYTHKPLVPERQFNDTLFQLVLLALSILCLLSVAYVFYILKSIPLIHMIKNPGFDHDAFRITASREFPGSYTIKNIAEWLTPILSYTIYLYKRLYKKLRYQVWFICLFILSILIVTYSLAKSPLIFYLMGFIFIRVYYKGAINKKVILYFGIIMIFLLFVIYYLMMGGLSGNTNKGDIITAIMSRIFFMQIESNFIHFDVFPRLFHQIGISSLFPKYMSNLFGLTYSEPSSRIVMEYMEPDKVSLGTAGVRNSLFISEAWANFGLIGFLLSPIYVGFLIQCLYLFFLKCPKTPFVTSFFVYFSINDGTTTGINSYIYNEKVLILFSILIISYFLTYMIKQIISKHLERKSNPALPSIHV